jgi:hypothetical protein
MPQYPVSLVISPAKGCLAPLLSVKGRLTKGILEIEPETRTVKIYGTSPVASMVQHNLIFEDIQEIKGLGPLIMSIRLKDQREIQLKNVEKLLEILNLLSQYVPDKTPELVRKRIEKFDKRLFGN